MKASVKYHRSEGQLCAELTVDTSFGKIRFIPLDPVRVAGERSRLKGPFCPSEETLLENATSKYGTYRPLD